MTDLLSDEVRTPPSACPYCDHLLNAAASFNDGGRTMPRHGDFTVCVHCAQLLIFDEQMQLRKPSAADMALLRAERPLYNRMEIMARVIRDMDRRPPHERRPNRQERRAAKRHH